ncbi:hypothetical protein F4825DRAFT_430828 [Nemania diffusa]|nr:hypothetical protein F4825DRAFT_430828 [Nemania diffusa]
MCRRIITHLMHHDVAAPMIMDPVAPRPLIYANPLRTNFHRCELVLPPLKWLLNSPAEKCPYHTCCVPHTEVEYCNDLLGCLHYELEDDSFPPEECENFILEHHHKRLPYFGNEGVYREAVPATWRELARIRGDNSDWYPNFVHGPQYRPNWEEKVFAECEKLYTLENDTSILCAAMQDLMDFGTREMVQFARARVLEAESKLHEQRKLVFDLFEWASESCATCER